MAVWKKERLSPALLFAFVFACELIAHASLLRLPYFWDEAGYYIPAAYDLFRTGSIIPFSTLSNAHPPLLSLYLAAAWKVFGFAPVTTRVAMLGAASLALCAVFAIARDALGSRAAAAGVTVLSAAYPVFFAQSTLAHADMLAAAASLWGLFVALRGRPLWAAVVCFTLAALTKEIAVGTPLALACWAGVHRDWRRALWLCLPVVPLAGWFGYHRWRTGFTFGNPEYLRYNALGTMSPERVLLALGHRVLHLSVYLNLFVPVVLALGALLLPVVWTRLAPGLKAQVWVVIVANAVLFSLLGGALLTRYLLPEYPLVLLLATGAVYARFRRWVWFPAVGVGAFCFALLLPTPYRVAPEDTLAYRDAVLVEQGAIDYVAAHYPQGTVLTAWPVADALRKPELGYVRAPLAVAPIDNFSLGTLQAVAAQPPEYATAIVFSTKYAPGGLHLPTLDAGAEARYFDLRQDLSPAAVASLLGGHVVWEERRGAEWAAVLRFEHAQLAAVTGGGTGVW